MNEITEVGGWSCLITDKSLPVNLEKLKGKPLTCYQALEIFSAIGMCRNFRRAIDIGANYGLMSYHLSRNFDKVEAFEIDPDVRSCLEINVRKHNMDNVTIHPYGCGPRHQQVKMQKINDHSFSTRVDPIQHGAPDAEIVPLDSFDWKDVDLIKIDAEGFEGMIIQGGLDLIARSSPIILYEKKDAPLRDYGHHELAPLEMLSFLGYRMLIDLRKNGVIGPKQKIPFRIEQ